MPDREHAMRNHEDTADAASSVDEPDIERTATFSDAVFAIAMTLLALDVRLPPTPTDPSGPELGGALLHLWPQYLALVISFFFIGIGWMNHHRMFGLLRRANTTLQLVNLGLLFVIITLPFPTSVLAEQLGRPGEQVAGLVYNGFFVAIALVFTALWRVVLGSAELHRVGISRTLFAQLTRQYRFGPLLYVGVLLVGLVSVPLSLALHLVLAGFFARTGFRKRPQPKPT